MSTMLKTFPSGKFRKMYVALCTVRDFGDYSFTPAEINLNSGSVVDNYKDLKPSLLRIGRKRFYIGGQTVVAETKETKTKPSKTYYFLPVYASMAFGAPCVGRLIQTESGEFVGNVGRYKVAYNQNERFEWEKKDGEVISFTVARVECYAY